MSHDFKCLLKQCHAQKEASRDPQDQELTVKAVPYTGTNLLYQYAAAGEKKQGKVSKYETSKTKNGQLE